MRIMDWSSGVCSSDPRLVVLKIGGTAQLPAPPATTLAWNPPPQFGTPQQVAAGKAHFGRYCQVCHGDSAIGNGFTPDLRVSGTLVDADAWKDVVLDGALKDRGMVSFARVLTDRKSTRLNSSH